MFLNDFDLVLLLVFYCPDILSNPAKFAAGLQSLVDEMEKDGALPGDEADPSMFYSRWPNFTKFLNFLSPIDVQCWIPYAH